MRQASARIDATDRELAQVTTERDSISTQLWKSEMLKPAEPGVFDNFIAGFTAGVLAVILILFGLQAPLE